MLYPALLIEELNLLMKFPRDSDLTGIKIHSTAVDETQNAAQRLHKKGLISQLDGGYLTPSGHQAAVHAAALLQLLKD